MHPRPATLFALPLLLLHLAVFGGLLMGPLIIIGLMIWLVLTVQA